MLFIPLEFNQDAICLSGLTGTKLKCDVIGEYYPFWWGITSGGANNEYRYSTSIIELNAATGEDYIEDIDEIILGSTGHALKLKTGRAPHTRNLKVILIEEDLDCYNHLKNVIRRRWPSVSIDQAEGALDSDGTNIYLLNKTLDQALAAIEGLELGNAIYFFDPLRGVEHSIVESVAVSRMRTFYRTGTEFIIFVFTSDWFLGRDDFAPLPCTTDEDSWTREETRSVSEADDLFGGREWRRAILNNELLENRERDLVELYKTRLHRWFRYILPLPFKPKQGQMFHIFLCSNFEIGVRATRDFYTSKTGNPKYQPDNAAAFALFRELHPEVCERLTGRRRPLYWRILWNIIRQHEEGICDRFCKDLREIEPNNTNLQTALEWLRERQYLVSFDVENAWDSTIEQYKLDWTVVRRNLNVTAPSPLRPLSPEDISGANRRA